MDASDLFEGVLVNVSPPELCWAWRDLSPKVGVAGAEGADRSSDCRPLSPVPDLSCREFGGTS